MRLYNEHRTMIGLHSVVNAPTFFIQTNMLFTIDVISGTATIFSVKQDLQAPDGYVVHEVQNVIDATNIFINWNYTIFLHESITIRITSIDGTYSEIYEILYEPYVEPEHYQDLLTNYDLPTYELLEPAMINNIDSVSGNDIAQHNMIARLLLDFKHIIKHKGTITGIEKFLYMIGFNPDSIKVYSEYITPNGNKTINPNKRVDKKTGDYHVLFDNYIVDDNDKYTSKNLPKRLINITDLDELFKRLYYAITVANVYFTLPEQDIVFFGLNYSSNAEQYLSITSRTTINYDFTPHKFSERVNINVFNYVSGDTIIRNDIVKHNIQQESNILYKSKIKYIPFDTTITNNELYKIEREVFEDITDENDLNMLAKFGNIIHLQIVSPDTFIEYEIRNTSLSVIKQNKLYLTTNEPHALEFVANRIGKHYLTIKVTDNHNNQEVYTYTFDVSHEIANIDFNMYNSVRLTDVIESNHVTSITSQAETNEVTENVVVDTSLLGSTLDDYYVIGSSDEAMLSNIYRRNNKQYKMPEINKNFVIDETTELPVDYMDNWIDIATFKRPSFEHALMIRYYDMYTCTYKLANIGEIIDNKSNNDTNIFVTEMLINEDDTNNMYYFITTNCVGIDLRMFDLCIVELIEVDDMQFTGEVHNIFEHAEMFDMNVKRQDMHYDIPLFHRTYAGVDTLMIDGNTTHIKSIIPRLTQNNFTVKLGEFIVCKADDTLLTSHINLVWEVRNAFSDELMHETTDEYLKYRVNERMIYKVVLKFNFRLEANNNFSIIKESIVSSL